jgi:hypothetical protein
MAVQQQEFTHVHKGKKLDRFISEHRAKFLVVVTDNQLGFALF